MIAAETQLYGMGRRHGIWETLESLVDPRMFFRINRSLFIQINSIKKITNLSTGRINLDLDGYADNPATVSRSKTSAFKNWLDQ